MLFGIFVLVLAVVTFVLFNLEKKSKALGTLISLILIAVPLTSTFFKAMAMKNSIDNKSWIVTADTVKRTKSSTDDDGDTSYYIYLTNNGKVSVSSRQYYSYSSGTSVYIVLVQGSFGKTYSTNLIYPTSSYTYYNIK